MNKQMNRSLLGAAIAGLLSAGLAGAEAIPAEKLQCKEDLSPCYGVNKCGGKGACSSATHACGGQNSCKGTGWVPMPKASCEAVGGSITPVKASKRG